MTITAVAGPPTASRGGGKDVSKLDEALKKALAYDEESEQLLQWFDEELTRRGRTVEKVVANADNGQTREEVHA